jgi:hypothetical protein
MVRVIRIETGEHQTANALSGEKRSQDRTNVLGVRVAHGRDVRIDDDGFALPDEDAQVSLADVDRVQPHERSPGRLLVRI